MKITRRVILTGALVSVLALPAAGMAGSGRGMQRGAGQQSQMGAANQSRQRLQDGSCVNGVGTGSGAMQRRGKSYGPGDGTGNSGTGPRDGTGFGAPGSR